MSIPTARRTRWVFLTLALACTGEPTQPISGYTRIQPGDTIAGALPAKQYEMVYAFPGLKDSLYVVFLQSLSGNLRLDVADSTRSLPLAGVYATPDSSPMLEHRSEVFQAFSTAPYVVSVTTPFDLKGGAYRFLVYPVHTAPESRPARFAIGDTASGETIETSADVDQFVFSGQAGTDVIGYVRNLGAAGFISFTLGTKQAGSAGGDTSLERQATGRMHLATTQDYSVIVRSITQPGFETSPNSPYLFQVRPVNFSPETAPVAVTLGDTVDIERIDYVGDVDDFTLPGGAGQEVNVFLQGRSGTVADSFAVDIRSASDTAFHSAARSGGADPELLRHATGRFIVPVGAGPVLRFRGLGDRLPHSDRGPYRFSVYPVNRAPESTPDSLAPGDSVGGETIEVPGDVDEYSLTISDSSLINYVVRRGPSTSSDSLQLEVSGPDTATGLVVVEDPPPAGGDSSAASGVGLRAPGRYRIRMEGHSDRGDGYSGPYRLAVYRIDSLPEVAAETLAIGDTVTEPLEPLGDRDHFVFAGTALQHINASVTALSGSGYFLLLRTPSGVTAGAATVGTPTGRLDLTETGWYQIDMVPINGGQVTHEHGEYRLALVPVLGHPETAPDTVVPGDSIWTESLDSTSDLDEFTIVGAPQQELAVFFRTTLPVTLDVLDTATGAILASVPAAGATPRFLLPASGRAHVRVYGSGGALGAVGPYSFSVFPIERAPESVAATAVLGDTVAGETIDPVVDVDEFAFSGTAGQTVTILFDTPTGAGYPGHLLQLYDPVADSVLGNAVSYNPSTTFGDIQTGPIILPRTGTYVIRVQAVNNLTLPARPYRFLIK